MVPSTFGVAGMGRIKHALAASFMMALRLDMDLGDERAGGVEIEEIAPRCRPPEPISARRERKR
jgi:hypothetical protein